MIPNQGQEPETERSQILPLQKCDRIPPLYRLSLGNSQTSHPKNAFSDNFGQILQKITVAPPDQLAGVASAAVRRIADKETLQASPLPQLYRKIPVNHLRLYIA